MFPSSLQFDSDSAHQVNYEVIGQFERYYTVVRVSLNHGSCEKLRTQLMELIGCVPLNPCVLGRFVTQATSSNGPALARSPLSLEASD